MATRVHARLRARGFGWAVGVLAAGVLALACSSEKEPAAGETACRCNSDCTGGRVKAFGLCREPCTSARDCPAEERCVLVGDGNAACQPRPELICRFMSDCAVPLACAADMTCRNTCKVSADCVEDDVCTSGQVCATATELTPEGDLVDGPPGANAGGASPD